MDADVLRPTRAHVVVENGAKESPKAPSAPGAIYVARLTFRMHVQHTDPDVRRRCLDLIDQLVVLRAHNIESDLETIER